MNENVDGLAVNLDVYVRRLLAQWRQLAAAALGCGVALLAVSFSSPPVFTSNAVVTPSDAVTRDIGSEVNVGSIFGASALRSTGFMGLAGDRSQEYYTVLSSEDFARRVLLERDWVPVLFPDGWNEKEKRWTKGGGSWGFNPLGALANIWHSISAAKVSIEPFSGYDRLTAKAAALQMAGGPQLYAAVQKFDGIVNFDLDARTGFITISATARNPADARMFVQGVIDELNAIEREHARRNAQSEVAFLKNQIAIEQNETIRDAYLNVLQRQLKIQMLSTAVKDYAVREMVAPYVPEVKSAPRRKLYFIFGVIVGLMGYSIYQLAVLTSGVRGFRIAWSYRRPFRFSRERVTNTGSCPET